MSAEPLGWQRAIAEALVAAGVDVVAYVPDARLRGVIAALRAARRCARSPRARRSASDTRAASRPQVVNLRC